MKGALLVAGATSDAGKSVLVTGICRWLYRHGISVAPFKAQNMSNNSVVAFDERGVGGEIGRAQALQAFACGLAPSVRFNPVLLKPGSDHASQVIVFGQPIGSINAHNYRSMRSSLRDVAFSAFEHLRAEFDVVICEGAGSPAEINLRDGDFVNMGLARAAGLPTIVVADIDRGGVFAALYGTLAILDKADQEHIAGFVINKFRGDITLLNPGIDQLTQLTNRPTYGVLPWRSDLWLDAEDSLAYGRTVGRPRPPAGSQWLRVAVVRMPRLSNATDVEALAVEPGVRVQLTQDPSELADTDLIVLPGTKSTVEDLDWLRRGGLAQAIVDHAASGRPVLGICGGFQMLGERLDDSVESRRGMVEGLGLIPMTITFAERKTLARPRGMAWEMPVEGYEIHHGYVSHMKPGTQPFIRLSDGRSEGAVAGAVFGTHWHGIFESDAFRRVFLTHVAKIAGRQGFIADTETCVSAYREQNVDILADLIEEHLDTKELIRLIERGVPLRECRKG